MGAAWKVDAILTVITEATEILTAATVRSYVARPMRVRLVSYVGLHIGRRHQPHRMPQRLQLARPRFAAVASCAVCEITGFAATEVAAQGAQVATTPGITQGATVARRTHPGIESSYLLEGRSERPVQRSADPRDQKRRYLPDTARYAPCRWQAFRRQEHHSNQVCFGEGKNLASPA
jgi:hypothetical protein